MSRDNKEWRGKTDDVAIPDRVRVRVFLLGGGRCDKCTKLIHTGEPWQCDHAIALVNGGQNRENNLRILCVNCHKGKTGEDVAEKAVVYAKKKRHLGLKKSRWRPMPGTRRSGIRRRLDGKVSRW